MSEDSEPGVTVKLSAIYDIVLKLAPLPDQLAEHIRLASIKDDEQDSRLNAHARRQDEVEERVTRIEAAREAEAKAAADSRTADGRRPPWTAMGALLVSAVVGLITLIEKVTS